MRKALLYLQSLILLSAGIALFSDMCEPDDVFAFLFFGQATMIPALADKCDD